MYSFKPTDEQQMIIDTVRQFAQEQLRAHGSEANEAGALDARLVAQGRELGLVPANIPEAYGGFGESYSALSGVLYAEALAGGDLATALHLLAPAAVAVALLRYGSEEQKATYLPRFADDGFFASAALVEPMWNFDAAHMATTATPSNGSYILNGRKSYVIRDGEATESLLLVYARDEAQGTTQAFLVPSDHEGVTVGERERGMALHALAFHTVTFDEVEVPAAARLGGEAGIEVNALLTHARLGAAAVATGVAAASYEYAQAYAKEREAFGKPVAQFQAIAFLLAEMRIAIESMRLLTWEAAWRLDQGQDATEAAVIARQFADEYALQVADCAVQILGGHGYIREYPVERWLREARGVGVVEGLAWT